MSALRVGRRRCHEVRRGEPRLRYGVPLVSLSRSLPPVIALACLSATACVSEYRPPTAADPHAIFKLRGVYEMQAGTDLAQTMLVNGHRALNRRVPSQVAKAPLADSTLLYPVPAKIEVAGEFSHMETRLVSETYYEQVPYTTYETYSCGFGTSYQTCTRSVTQYRSEQRTRMVMRSVSVSDGSCKQAVWLAPAVDHVYLVDFTYRQSAVCSATCLEQIASETPGEFNNQPCPVPTPAQIQAAPQ